MSSQRISKSTTMAIILVLAVLLAIIIGFTASNNVPESGAGEGAGTIVGYDISDITYRQHETDRSKIVGITFYVNPQGNAFNASVVKISVDDGNTWIDCNIETQPRWNCPFAAGSEPNVADLSNLRIVAVQ